MGSEMCIRDSHRNMAKGESLMGEVATDWMDTECPEAKRLKVVSPPLTPALRVLGWGLMVSGRARKISAVPGSGEQSQHSPHPAPGIFPEGIPWPRQ